MTICTIREHLINYSIDITAFEASFKSPYIQSFHFLKSLSYTPVGLPEISPAKVLEMSASEQRSKSHEII